MSDAAVTKAVVLARGLGTRMRAAAAPDLTAEQSAAADAGMKAMMPVGPAEKAPAKVPAPFSERPLVDYVLAALADAGVTRICLVIGPEHEAIRRHYRDVKPTRVTVRFATQARPLGTADAVLAAEAFVGDDPFICINGDNYYPVAAFRALSELGGPGLVGFDRDGLVGEGNIDPDRISRFAVVRTDAAGRLAEIVEKPDPDWLANVPGPVAVSMNCWRFDASIFDACRSVELSARGELELPDAVRLLIDSHPLRVAPLSAGVLDLSSRDDVAAVAARLADVEVNL